MKITTFILLLSTLLIMTYQQSTNFDYNKHGSDWAGDCNSDQANKQSPIILPKIQNTSNKTSYLFADFRNVPASATIYNTTVYIKPTSSQNFFGEISTKTIDLQPLPFKAFQIRIRTRSQHRIENENGYYDLEIQIFLKQLFDSSKNIKLNIGLLFQADQTYDQDPFLAQIISKAKDINQTFSISADLGHLLSRQQLFDFWFYQGSTTMPPCTNGKINWIIPTKIYKMNTTQLNFFTKLYPSGNWRDVRPILDNQIGYAKASTLTQIQF